MNAKDQLLFNAGVKGELRTAGLMTDETPDEKAEDLATVYIDKWLEEPDNENQMTTDGVVDCLLHFREWLVTAPKLDASTITPVNITVTLSIPVNDKASIQLSLSAIPGADLGKSMVEAYDLVTESAMFLRTKRLGSSSQIGTNSNGTTVAGGAETIDVTTVTREDKNGKSYFRVKGGRWVKFGIACWKEVWDAAGIDPKRYQTGDNPVNFKAVLALGTDGKPDKVSQIISQ